MHPDPWPGDIRRDLIARRLAYEELKARAEDSRSAIIDQVSRLQVASGCQVFSFSVITVFLGGKGSPFKVNQPRMPIIFCFCYSFFLGGI